MTSCETFQDRVLPFLYELLEADERQEVEAHLASCPACTLLLDQARARLTEAAKETFAEVRFELPKETLPMPQPRRPIAWRRVLVAACLLIVVGGGTVASIVGKVHFQRRLDDKLAREKTIQTETKAIEARLSEHRRASERDIGDLKQQVDDLVKKQKKADTLVRTPLADLTVTGPPTIQAGATNFLHVVTNMPGKRPVDVRIVATDSRKVLFEQKVPPQGKTNLTLGPDVPVPSPNMVTLELPDLQVAGQPQQLSLSKLRYLTHLATDRPMYRPGDVVHYRSLTLERFTLQPAREDLHVQFRILGPQQTQFHFREGKTRLLNAEGKEIEGPDDQPLRGLAAGDFQLPPNLPGGVYTLSVAEAGNRFPPEQRSFLVNQWQTSRLNKELTFHRKSYGPGETVTINARASNADGSPMQPSTVRLVAEVDRVQVFNSADNENFRTDADGKVTMSFVLPQQIQRGVGSVTLTFLDGANEAIVRPLPIVTNRLQVSFFPEGGDLIAGAANRVYFQARSSLDKPADLRGRIVEIDTAKNVADVATLTDDAEPGINQGLGAFTFAPQAGKRYRLLVDAPVGIQGEHVLPAVRAAGVVLHTPQGVVDQSIPVVVKSVGRDRKLLIGAYCRGGLLDQVRVEAPAGKDVSTELKTSPAVGGVHRVTVFEVQAGKESRLVPVAERLVYRQATAKLKVSLRTNKDTYQPGEKAELWVDTTDETGKKTPAVVMVAVVDKALLQLADEKTFRSLPTHFLLTSEVRKPEDLEYADFLLGTHAKATTALDLLLGTQGWRRFAEQDPGQFALQHTPDSKRLLLANGAAGRETVSFTSQEAERADQQFVARFVALERRIAAKEKNVEGTDEMLVELGVNQRQLDQVVGELEQAREESDWYDRMFTRWIFSGVLIGMILIGIACMTWGVRRLDSGRPPHVPFAISGVLFVSLILVGLAGLGYMITERDHEGWWRGPRGMGGTKKAWAAGPGAMAVIPVDDALAQGVQQMGDLMDDKDKDNAEPQRQEVPGPNFEREQLVALAKARMWGIQQQDGERKGGRPMDPAILAIPEPLANGGDPQSEAERELRRQGRYEELLEQTLGRRIRLPLPADMFVVREYAHQHKVAADDVRRDFAELLCWQPALVTKNGSATLGFDLSDSNTRFEVLAFAHALDGRLGAGAKEFVARLPFSVEPVVPFEITSGDKVQVPLTITNTANVPTNATVQLFAKDLHQPDMTPKDVIVGANERSKIYLPFTSKILEGTTKVQVTGKFGNLRADRVERSMRIVPEGFPVEVTQNGLLENSAKHTLTVPDNANLIEGSLQCKVEVFPSVLADLQKGLEAMLREPSGCFEQTSSCNYPNVMILSYLQETKQARPDLEQQSRRLMQSGYGKLTSFECVPPEGKPGTPGKQGYEWFGGSAPPHEALTAYGLLQFHDMKRFYPVDEDMLKRTRAYLLAQRDDKGGFRRNPRALDRFGRAPEHITNAYIVWALTETGADDMTKELDALMVRAKDSRDGYFLSLVGLGMLNANRTADAMTVLGRVADVRDKKTGAVPATETSITGSGGRDLQVETTALAVLGWLRANRPDQFQPALNAAAKWIAGQRSAQGGFGATQSTILALKALIAHTRAAGQANRGGEIQVTVNQEPGQPPPPDLGPGGFPAPAAVLSRNVPPGIQDSIVFDLSSSKLLKNGSNVVTLETTGNNHFPYTVALSYRALKPANQDKCAVRLSTELSKGNAREGDSVRLTATLENRSGKGQGMTVAILGLPAGLTLPEDLTGLKDLTRPRDDGKLPGVISAFEIRGQGRELVLYWRELDPKAKIEVDVDLICRIPGEYRGPASRAYLYYTPEHKFWCDPLAIKIRE